MTRVIDSLAGALTRGYRPYGHVTARRDVGAMCVHVVDRRGDVALVALTSDEWAEQVWHTADGRERARSLRALGSHVMAGMVAGHVRARGGRWVTVSA